MSRAKESAVLRDELVGIREVLRGGLHLIERLDSLARKLGVE